MNLEKLTRKAIASHRIDPVTIEEIQTYLDRRSHLAADEYEALRTLGRALRSGAVTQSEDASVDRSPAALA